MGAFQATSRALFIVWQLSLDIQKMLRQTKTSSRLQVTSRNTTRKTRCSAPGQVVARGSTFAGSGAVTKKLCTTSHTTGFAVLMKLLIALLPAALSVVCRILQSVTLNRSISLHVSRRTSLSEHFFARTIFFNTSNALIKSHKSAIPRVGHSCLDGKPRILKHGIPVVTVDFAAIP